MTDQKYWLGFSLISGIGPKRLLQLHEWFGDLSAAWRATEADLARAGLSEAAIALLCEGRSAVDLDAEMTKVQQSGAWLLTWTDDRYPDLLRRIDDPPALLYVRGRLTPEDARALSIVGTRKATRYGTDATRELAHDLAAHGVTVVSGLAHGIDSAAHQGALDAGGRTIAVLGCGIDIIYPHDHRELAQRILGNGAIISEFPIGMQPIAANFPRRNRLLSGLSLGVLVAEAPEKSGSLITATFAAEQGREVFAVPANIFNHMGRGTNRLLQDGAKLVTNVEDILNELNIMHEQVQTRQRAERVVPANNKEALLLNHLQADPIHVDDLARLCGLPIAEVTGTLTIMELKGLAQTVGPMQYSRVP